MLRAVVLNPFCLKHLFHHNYVRMSFPPPPFPRLSDSKCFPNNMQCESLFPIPPPNSPRVENPWLRETVINVYYTVLFVDMQR